MKIAVMGAGAVGCYFGGLLALAGHEVVLIGRPAHVEAVNARGLRLERAGRTETVPMRASTEASAVQGADIVLVCVKSADTEEAGAEMRAYLSSNALILSLQNGVDNAERLAAALGRSVIQAVVYVGTDMAGPGHVRHHGAGRLVLGPAPEALVAALEGAEIPSEISDNIQGALWAKMIVNCAYNAISAISQLPYGRFAGFSGAVETMHEVVRECLAVASALGVVVPGDMFEAVANIARTMPAQSSSTAQDLARGRKTEIDYLNGYITSKGAALGVPTPVNRALYVLVKMLEA